MHCAHFGQLKEYPTLLTPPLPTPIPFIVRAETNLFLLILFSNIEFYLEGIKNKRRLQTLSIDNAWSSKNFLYYLTFRMLQHTSSEVNGYNCYKHLKIHKKRGELVTR